MSQIWEIVQAHIDAYGPSEAEVARRMGTSPQTLNSWKKRGLRKLPDAHLLLGLARVTQTPYEDVLRAALSDIRYLPKEVVEHDARSAPMNKVERSPRHDPQVVTRESAPDREASRVQRDGPRS